MSSNVSHTKEAPRGFPRGVIDINRQEEEMSRKLDSVAFLCVFRQKLNLCIGCRLPCWL